MSHDTGGIRLPRRSLIVGAAAGVGALALGQAHPGAAQAASAFVKGADISWMPQMEANGFWWNNSAGVRQDLFTILRGYGITAARLRVWVNPSDDPANGHCSLDETAALAVRCRDAGLRVLISLHFGDTWNSVGHQTPPAAWANQTYSQLLQTMYDYVYHVMNVLKFNRVTPAWVAIGNETNSGICKPVGGVNQPAQMTGLLNAAYDMVKEVFAATPVMVHLAQPQKLDSIRTFLDRYRDNGGRWDITGLSSYASGANVPVVLDAMKTIQSTYGRPVMQVEAGGPVSKASQTRTALTQFITGLQSFGGLGTFYWEPEGYAPFTDYDMVAWDSATRRPTAALDAFTDV